MDFFEEKIILENLIFNEEFNRSTIAFINEEYFQSSANRIVFNAIKEHTLKYSVPPTKPEIVLWLDKNCNGVSADLFDTAIDVVDDFTKSNKAESTAWLIDTTEEFCKNQALHNAVAEAAVILSGDDKTRNRGAIPELITNALAVSFDQSIGLEYSDAETKWERRRADNSARVSFSTEAFNRATNGGMKQKTLSVVVAGTGVGKSIFMCDAAAFAYEHGEHVLYITLEMSEDEIGDRIDANLLGLDLDDVKMLPKDDYCRRLKAKTDECKGSLFIKEYPTSAAGCLEFRALLNDLKIKKRFAPTFIVVDYLNICTSSRYKAGAVNSYTFIKAIAEELRGLAKEYNCAILSGTQLNKDGIENDNVSLKEISESNGLSFTVDFMFALMRTPENDAVNQVLVKQLKNRFRDMTQMLRFAVGLTRARMKFSDVKIQKDYYSTDNTTSSSEERSQPIEIRTGQRKVIDASKFKNFT